MEVRDIRVGDCMVKGVVTLNPDNTVEEAAKLLKKNKIGCVVIIRKEKPIGIVTEGDITYKIVAEGKNPKKVKLRDIMSSPLKAIGPEKTIEKVAGIMRDDGIKRLPVVNEKGKLIGLITETDIIRVSPMMYDIIREKADIEHFGTSETFTGVCEVCGTYSESLKRSAGKLACEECSEEEEV
jgi:CBS domain-containing protein